MGHEPLTATKPSRAPKRNEPGHDQPAHRIDFDRVDQIARCTKRTPLSLPLSFDVGEQVVGSSELFTIDVVVAPRTASASVTQAIQLPQRSPAPGSPISGVGAFSPEVPSRMLTQQVRDIPLQVRFRPHRRGEFRADLAVDVKWECGDVEQHVIAIFGSARNVDDPPSQPAEAKLPAGPVFAPSGKEPSVSQGLEFLSLLQVASNRAADIATRQQHGVNAAQTNLANATHVPSESSRLGVFAELAIMIATGGIAQVACKALAQLVVPAELPQVVDGLGSGLKDALKDSVRRASAAPHEQPKSTGNEPTPLATFIARQNALLANTAKEHRDLITSEQRRLISRLADHPREVLSYAEKLGAALVQAGAQAADVQERSTVSQWASVVAAERYGVRESAAGGPATEMRNVYRDGWGYSKPGVLRVDGTLADTNTGQSIAIKTARLDEVNAEALGKLLDVPLGELHIPMVIELLVGIGRGILISRDESGRLLVFAQTPESHGGSTPDGINQASVARRAQDIAAVVLGRSLIAWGVNEIISNTRTGDH